ncbi:glycosyltransferase family 92 protein [bacterium]|nr:glycosyltransferase family 92 protein [bacterium]
MKINIKNKIVLSFIEMGLNIPYRLLFILLSLFQTKDKETKEYFISICAIFKNEARYMAEWIEYHKMLGVDHIYLYDNNSEDNYRDVIAPYINEGFITLKSWPMEHGQMAAYEDCYKSNRKDTKWLAFIDLDEFICPQKETDIKKWLIKYELYPAVSIYWQMFGTNGHIEPNYDKLVIEQYTHAWSKLEGIGKIILNTNEKFKPTHIYHHHIFNRFKCLFFTIKVPMISENKKFIFFPQIYKAPKNNTIQLNHYWSKSFNEYSSKVKKGDVASIENFKKRQNLDFFYMHEKHNVCENKVIWRFLINLKLRLNMKN